MSVNPHEFASVMTPVMFRAASIASGARTSLVLHKMHENVPGTDDELDRASRVDILSDVDLAIQEMLLATILEHWPDINIIAEEDTPTKARFTETSSSFCILIDPIDGTKNYLKGDSHYCHIVSLTRDREMLATLLYSHALGRLFVAIRAGGTNVLSEANSSERIQVPPHVRRKTFFRHVSRIPDALARDLDEGGFKIAVSTQNASDILTILDGEAVGFISYTPLIYDVWSPGMIIQEAGGWISDWCGHPLVFERKVRLPHVLIATSSKIAEEAIKMLEPYVASRAS